MGGQRRLGAGDLRAGEQVGAGFLETGVDADRRALFLADLLAPAGDPAAAQRPRLPAETAPVSGFVGCLAALGAARVLLVVEEHVHVVLAGGDKQSAGAHAGPEK